MREDETTGMAKMPRQTISGQLSAAEEEIKRQGGQIADLQDLVKELYNALGIPSPPTPERGETPDRIRAYRG